MITLDNDDEVIEKAKNKEELAEKIFNIFKENKYFGKTFKVQTIYPNADFSKLKSIAKLIEYDFMGSEKKHIKKLKKKAKKYKSDNFIGCLIWFLPDNYSKFDFDLIEQAFKNVVSLEFDLYIFLGNTRNSNHFLLHKKTTKEFPNDKPKN